MGKPQREEKGILDSVGAAGPACLLWKKAASASTAEPSFATERGARGLAVCRSYNRNRPNTDQCDAPRKSGPQFRRPTSVYPNSGNEKNLSLANQSLGVSGECARGGDCRFATLVDAGFAPTLLYIAERWQHLPPHIREGVLALVDAGQCNRSAKESLHEVS